MGKEKTAGKGKKFCPHCNEIVGARVGTCPICEKVIPPKVGNKPKKETNQETHPDLPTALQLVQNMGGVNVLRTALEAYEKAEGVFEGLGGVEGAKWILTQIGTLEKLLDKRTEPIPTTPEKEETPVKKKVVK